MTNQINHDKELQQVAEFVTKQSEFGFCGAKGGTIDLVSNCSPEVKSAASQILSTFGNAGSIVKESALGAGVGAAASVMMLGTLSVPAAGIGAMAGVISSISKGRQV
ncbi:MAG: hypothetical protein ACOYNL_07085 [Rickettsiales bacterium]